MAGKWQPFTGINSSPSRDALNCSAPLGKRCEIKQNLESISDGAPRAAHHRRGSGPFPFPSLSVPPTPCPALPAAVGSRRTRVGSAGYPDPLRTSAGVPPRRGAASAGTSGRARPLPAGTSGGRGGRPSAGAGGAALGAAPSPVGAGRAGAARRGEAARWGGRPVAWPRSGCCCSWRWGTPGRTGRSRRTATGECPPAAGPPALLFFFAFLLLFSFSTRRPVLQGGLLGEQNRHHPLSVPEAHGGAHHLLQVSAEPRDTRVSAALTTGAQRDRLELLASPCPTRSHPAFRTPGAAGRRARSQHVASPLAAPLVSGEEVG